MGSNPTQAWGLILFLVAWVVIAAGMAGGGMIVLLLGIVVLAASLGVLLKAKPLEHVEQ